MHRLDRAREHIIGLYRIVIGFLFACHGLKALFGMFGAKSATAVGTWPNWWAALIELVCGTLLCVGLGSRYAALLGSGSMAFAYFTVHLPKNLFPIQNGGEAAALFCWALLIIAFVGPGRFALSNLPIRQTASEPTRAGASV